MEKREPLKLEETNLALFGSDVEKKIKAAAAEQEDAWKGCGQAAGVQVWRVEKFKVVAWPKDKLGVFFDGDSYICLHTYKKDGKDDAPLQYDIYFWLGKFTTQDEAGTAAYKTVELDDFLGGKPVQHREVQGYETMAFLQLFPNSQLVILEGGVESGFQKVPAAPQPTARLFHVHGKTMRTVEVDQINPVTIAALNEGDTFILDYGPAIYCFQGKTCSPGERNKASSFAAELAEGRKAGKVHVVSSEDAPEEFWALLGAQDASKRTISDTATEPPQPKQLFRVSDEGKSDNSVDFDKVAEGETLKLSMLDAKDAFVIDLGKHVFTWIGEGASVNERGKALVCAEKYLRQNGRPLHTPIVKVNQGFETKPFLLGFA